MSPNLVRWYGTADWSQNTTNWYESSGIGVVFTGQRSVYRLITANFGWYNLAAAVSPHMGMGIFRVAGSTPPAFATSAAAGTFIGVQSTHNVPAGAECYGTVSVIDQLPVGQVANYFIMLLGGAAQQYAVYGSWACSLSVVELF